MMHGSHGHMVVMSDHDCSDGRMVIMVIAVIMVAIKTDRTTRITGQI